MSSSSSSYKSAHSQQPEQWACIYTLTVPARLNQLAFFNKSRAIWKLINTRAFSGRRPGNSFWDKRYSVCIFHVSLICITVLQSFLMRWQMQLHLYMRGQWNSVSPKLYQLPDKMVSLVRIKLWTWIHHILSTVLIITVTGLYACPSF